MAAPQDYRRATNCILLWGVAVSFLCLPPLFGRLFAPSFLVASDRAFLWALAASLLALAGALRLWRGRAGRGAAVAVYFGLLTLVTTELVVRGVLCRFFRETTMEMARIGVRAYPQLAAYRGHPFAQFTGRPRTTVVEDEILGELTTFNNFGFFGERDFYYEKPNGVVRVVTLGGSTTASGYPSRMETYLNRQLQGEGGRFEVLNFGIGWYNTAHSLAHFVFTVRDFSADYVVIHHATNEYSIRRAGADFRSDYTHALKAFEVPVPRDWPLIRLSVLYRYLRLRLHPDTNAAGLEQATNHERVRSDELSRLEELQPFRRNLKTIIDLALLDGVVPVLTTQPYQMRFAESQELWKRQWKTHMIQANTVLREIAADYGDKILFVELDRKMTGEMDDVFRDFVHVNEEGLLFKATAIGKAILEHRAGR